MNKTLKFLVTIFVIAIPGYLGFIHLKNWHHGQIETAVDRSRLECFDIIRKLEDDIATLRKEMELYSPIDIPAEKISSVFGSEERPDMIGNSDIDCNKTKRQVEALFSYLDQKKYLSKYKINEQFSDFFDNKLEEMSKRPPILAGEMEDIYLLIRNVTHFYRILGKNSILSLKEIAKEESEIIEPALAVLFQWGTQCRSEGSPSYQKISMDKLYIYSGFFLNTMSGRSYLLRRESKLRMLINYYSLRVLDIANDEKLNRLGIDIRPYIDFLFYDISNQKGLIYRERYLSVLAALQNKYF